MGLLTEWDDLTLGLVNCRQPERCLSTAWATIVDNYSIPVNRLITGASVLAYLSIHCWHSPRACRQRPSTVHFFCCYLQLSLKTLSSFYLLWSPLQFSTSVKISQIWAEHQWIVNSAQQLVAPLRLPTYSLPKGLSTHSSSKRAPSSLTNCNWFCSNESNRLSHMNLFILIAMENNGLQLEQM